MEDIQVRKLATLFGLNITETFSNYY